MKSIGLFVLGVAAGAVLVLLVQSDEAPQADVAVASGGADSNAERDMENLRQRMAAIAQESDDLPDEAQPIAAPLLKTPEERKRHREVLNRKRYTDAIEQETVQLLAAGFSQERIAWLRNRAAELDASRRRADTERQQKGLQISDAYEGLVYTFDYDLDLAAEIGADEYERYREALGRPNSVEIMSVRPGGIAATYGLKSGDMIVKYDGKRVYNIAQVKVLSNKQGQPGETAFVEVMRDGRPMQVQVLKGDLSVEAPFPPQTKSRALRIGVPEEDLQP
jgi:hypothetical protein